MLRFLRVNGAAFIIRALEPRGIEHLDFVAVLEIHAAIGTPWRRDSDLNDWGQVQAGSLPPGLCRLVRTAGKNRVYSAKTKRSL